MTVTAKLLRLFRVDQQLRGLRSRLDGAERFLNEQTKQLKDLETKHSTMSADLKKLKTAVAGDETESKTIQARIDSLREKMNATKTNKEYSALVTEVKNLEAKKKTLEDGELDRMGKSEDLAKQDAEMLAKIEERRLIANKAKEDRDAKAAEIKDRLAELVSERAEAAKDVPADVLRVFEDQVLRKGDDAMVRVEVLDRRNHDWACSGCFMALTVETINKLSTGGFTRCNNCECILYTEEDVVSKKKPKDNEDVAKSRKKVSKKKTDADADAEAKA
jgi:predicted  nucleic acid-binding Zn-ribbon protein